MKQVFALYDYRLLLPDAVSERDAEECIKGLYASKGGALAGARWVVYGLLPVQYSERHETYILRRNMSTSIFAGTRVVRTRGAAAKTKKRSKPDAKSKARLFDPLQKEGECTSAHCRIMCTGIGSGVFCTSCGRSVHPGAGWAKTDTKSRYDPDAWCSKRDNNWLEQKFVCRPCCQGTSLPIYLSTYLSIYLYI
jgi:hypothetical protein